MTTNSSSPRNFSWRGLLQSIFDVEDDALGNVASPIASARTPRWSRGSRNSRNSRGSQYSDTSPSPSSASSRSFRGDTAPTVPYSPSRLDGEYNVWFARKPLGLGLVPSTQLYGTWEISTIAPMAANAPPDEAHERQKIRRGDVLVAANYSTRHAQLSREVFALYLQRSACPVVLTMRRPSVYGSLDSRATSTAMFPTSIEYRGRDKNAESKTFHARAPSFQWKRNLQHELANKNKKRTSTASKASKSKQQHQKSTDQVEPTPEADPVSSSPFGAAVRDNRPRTQSTAQLTAMGEFTHVFHELPLDLILAPSTRLYGSVEVYDPRSRAPLIQIGDVILAVNGDSSVAQWPTDDAIDHIIALPAPVSVTFRRPEAYRTYLHTYFKSTNAQVSSRSTATAMFPDSAEYKRHGSHHYRNAKTTKPRHDSTAGRLGSTSTTQKTAANKKIPAKGSNVSKQEWQRISSELATSDQFKLWQSRSSTVNANTKLNAFGMAPGSGTSALASLADAWRTTSAFLTERHVHFLWSHLPAYLTTNDMELAYDTRHHGWNLMSFYALVRDRGPTLLVIKDTRDQIFGAFSSTSWKQSKDVYGNGRCFVFTLRPQMKVFQWSGLDDSFMYGQPDALLMGGGKKGIALCVQLDELRGFSHACDTFDSPPLAQTAGPRKSVAGKSSGDSGAFEIENMEVWCFSGLRV